MVTISPVCPSGRSGIPSAFVSRAASASVVRQGGRREPAALACMNSRRLGLGLSSAAWVGFGS